MEKLPVELKRLVYQYLDGRSLVNLYSAKPSFFHELQCYWTLAREFDYDKDTLYPTFYIKQMPPITVNYGKLTRFAAAFKGVSQYAQDITVYSADLLNDALALGTNAVNIGSDSPLSSFKLNFTGSRVRKLVLMECDMPINCIIDICFALKTQHNALKSLTAVSLAV